MSNEKKRQINRDNGEKKTEKMVNKHKNWQINKIKMSNKKMACKLKHGWSTNSNLSDGVRKT